MKDIILATLLLVGIVDQIEGNVALVEYEEHGKIKHSSVLLDQSPWIRDRLEQVGVAHVLNNIGRETALHKRLHK